MKKTPRKVVRRGNVEKNNTQKKLRRKKELRSQRKVDRRSQRKVDRRSQRKVDRRSQRKVDRRSQRKVDRRSQRKVDRRSQRKVDRRSQRKRTNKKNRKREENMIRIIGGGEETPPEEYNKESVNSLIRQILKIEKDDTFNKLFGERDGQEAFFIIHESDEGWYITCGKLVDDNIDTIQKLIKEAVIENDEELFNKENFLKDFKTLQDKQEINVIIDKNLPLTFVVNFLRVIKPENLLEATEKQLGVDLSRRSSDVEPKEQAASAEESDPVELESSIEYDPSDEDGNDEEQDEEEDEEKNINDRMVEIEEEIKKEIKEGKHNPINQPSSEYFKTQIEEKYKKYNDNGKSYNKFIAWERAKTIKALKQNSPFEASYTRLVKEFQSYKPEEVGEEPAGEEQGEEEPAGEEQGAEEPAGKPPEPEPAREPAADTATTEEQALEQAQERAEINPLKLTPEKKVVLKNVSMQKAENKGQADLEKKKQLILTDLQDDLKKYKDSDSEGEKLVGKNKLNHYRDLKAEIEGKTFRGAEIEGKTFRGDDLKTLRNIDMDEAQKIEDELQKLLEKAQGIIAELKEKEQQQKKEKEKAAAAAAAATEEANRKEEEKRIPQISNLEYITNTIFNYIKLLWKTQLFNNNKRPTQRVELISKKRDFFTKYYKTISVVPSKLLNIFDIINTNIGTNVNSKALNFIRMITRILEELISKFDMVAEVGQDALLQYNALAEIGGEIRAATFTRGTGQKQSKLTENMRIFLDKFCNNTKVREEDFEIQKCCDKTPEDKLCMSPLTFEKLIDNKVFVSRINSSKDIQRLVNNLHDDYPSVSPKDNPEDITEIYKVTNRYVSEINNVFKEVFPESSVSIHQKEAEATIAQNREKFALMEEAKLKEREKQMENLSNVKAWGERRRPPPRRFI